MNLSFPEHPSIAEVAVDGPNAHEAVSQHPHLKAGTMLIPNCGLWSWTVYPSPEQLFTLSPGTILYSAGVYEDPTNGGPVLSAYMIDLAEMVDDGAMHFNINKIGMAIANADGSAYGGPLTGDVIGDAARSGALQAMKIEGETRYNMRAIPSDIVYMDCDISAEGKPEDVEVVDPELVAWAQTRVAARWKVLTGVDADVALISIPTVPAERVAEFKAKGWRMPLDAIRYVFALRDSRLPNITHVHVNLTISDLTTETIDKALTRHLKRFEPSEAELAAAASVMERAAAAAAVAN